MDESMDFTFDEKIAYKQGVEDGIDFVILFAYNLFKEDLENMPDYIPMTNHGTGMQAGRKAIVQSSYNIFKNIYSVPKKYRKEFIEQLQKLSEVHCGRTIS